MDHTPQGSSEPLRPVRRFVGMNEEAAVCRRRAAECERAAVMVTQFHVQVIYRELARQWREMAEASDQVRLHSGSKKQRLGGLAPLTNSGQQRA
jgi:hypothetical protein